MNSGIDRISFRLKCHDESADEDTLNAWSAVSHHIDERLQDDQERNRLAARLAACRGTIKLTKPASSLQQLARKPNVAFDSVVVGDERATLVQHHLKERDSLICARFHSPDSTRRNLANAVCAPVPFVVLSRSPEAVVALNKLLMDSFCLRQLARSLKERIVHKPDAAQIAVIVDLPECRCHFEQAEQELIPNDNL